MVTLSPTIMDDGSYYFRFYARDIAHHPHDPHIHVVARDGSGAKFSLDPVALVNNRGLREHELTRVRNVIEKHQDFMLGEWYDYFGGA